MIGFLLVAALGSDHRFWEDAAPALERIAPCRALGQAELPLPAQVAFMDEQRRVAGWSQVIAVGCAVGSLAAAAYAATRPQHAAAAILANATDRLPPASAPLMRDRAARVRAGGMAAILPGAVDRSFQQQPRDERYVRFLDRFAAQDAERYARAIDVNLDYDVTPLLEQIICPTLVLAGGNDVPLPPEHARRVHAAIPGARFEQIDDAAHFMPYQVPARFAERAIAFVRGQLDIPALTALA